MIASILALGVCVILAATIAIVHIQENKELDRLDEVYNERLRKVYREKKAFQKQY